MTPGDAAAPHGGLAHEPTPWHLLPPDEACARLHTTSAGLSADEANRRRLAVGPNELPGGQRHRLARVILHQLRHPLIYLLMAAAIVSLTIRHVTDAAVIFAVVVLNAIVGTVQEYRAERALDALNRLAAPVAEVMRDGNPRIVASREIVPGDVLILEEGTRVAGDARVVGANELEVDASLLTGESCAVKLDTAPLTEARLPPQDQTNMAFMGSLVTRGSGRAVVVATGTRTQFGRISVSVREASRAPTPLEVRFQRFGRGILVAVVALAILAGVGATLAGLALEEAVLLGVALAVSAIPEGLPVVVTIALAVGLTRMARKRAIIRRLPAVETLGSCTVVASDKTGTLTRNEMTVQRLWVPHATYRVTGVGYAPDGEIVREADGASAPPTDRVRRLLEAGVLCNASHLVRTQGGRYEPHGDAMEVALIAVAAKGGVDMQATGEAHPEVASLPFRSERRYMATLRETAAGELVVYVKGAPEVVTELCAAPREARVAQTARGSADAFAKEGLRVLAAACAPWPRGRPLTHETVSTTSLTLLGIFGVMDPPRPEAVQAVETCHRGGIRVIMITGDHKETARVIAQRMGIADADAQALTGRELARLPREAFAHAVRRVNVFARVAPDQKLRIVQALREQGEVVAVTGDGVNDAPAVKSADIGIAMGVAGTDVTREASDMVLADDNFSTIVNAIEEGRIVFNNIRKVTYFLLSTSAGEILAVGAALLLGWPLVFLPAQILWINLVTNGTQDVALALEPGEPGLADAPPRDPREGIMTRTIWVSLAYVGVVLCAGTLVVFDAALAQTGDVAYARTAAVSVMVLFQFWHVFNARSRTRSILGMSLGSNPALLASVTAALLAQLAFVYAPPLQAVFQTVPLDRETWVTCALVSTSIILVEELVKIARRRRPARRPREGSVLSRAARAPDRPGAARPPPGPGA